MTSPDTPPRGGPPDAATRARIIRLAFGGNEQRYEEFLAALSAVTPPNVEVILRGSAVTGTRWADGEPFDSDGIGTSDLDVTFIGRDMLKFWDEFYIPKLHTVPLSDEHPNASATFAPLRRALCALAGRPVNLQASAGILQFVRDVLMDQPYVTLVEKRSEDVQTGDDEAATWRLLSYNIRYGGTGRESALADVIGVAKPDVVVLQEASDPRVVARLAEAGAFAAWGSRPGYSTGFLSRVPVAHHAWHHPRSSRHAFLEVALEGSDCRVFGLHLSAWFSKWSERRRAREIRALLDGIREHQEGFHVIAGDFNALAPGELLEAARMPRWIRAMVWLSGRDIARDTIQVMLDEGYTDAWRTLRPGEPGYTLPAWDPHVRLDYVFTPQRYGSRLRACEVIREPDAVVRTASDHLPLVVEIGE